MRVLIIVLLLAVCCGCKSQKEHCDAYSKLETKKTID